MTAGDQFSTDITGLPATVETETVELSAGSEFELGIGPVAKRIGDATVRMLAYNGSIPGPTLRCHRARRWSSTSSTTAKSRRPCIGMAFAWRTAIDGTHETQAPMPVGGSFTYQAAVP